MGDKATFDAFYYAHCCGRPYARDDEWLRFFGGIAERIAADIGGFARAAAGNASRVLDAGCAMGLLVEALVARGIDAHGVDISDYAIAQAAPAVAARCRVGSLASPDAMDGRYDLIVCIEVLEHMPPDEARAALANICAHTDDVLFSSSATDFGETTHVNVQPPEAWAEAFAREGFLRDLDYDASYITPWAVRFRRRSEPLPRIVREYERTAARLMIERNELRQQVLQFDRHVHTEAADAPKLRAELARVNGQLLAAEQRVAALDDTVRHMESSFFWRLRRVWTSIRGLFEGTR
jgi:SAM-dependent methyltransferase